MIRPSVLHKLRTQVRVHVREGGLSYNAIYAQAPLDLD